MSEQTTQQPVAKAAGDPRRRRCAWAAGASFVCLALVSLAWLHAVPLRVTEADRQALETMFDGPLAKPAPDDYAAQLAKIRRIQAVVANIAPRTAPIPHGQTREPSDLLRLRHGLCYDRSRTIEKALRAAGFRVRHAALYASDPTASPWRRLRALLGDRKLTSHSVSECLTAKGWLVVDSNHAWLSLDADGRPLALRDLQRAQANGDVVWRIPPHEAIYHAPFIRVYGLYSRHGRFYPPFNVVPDVNWREMLANHLRRQD